MCNGLYLDFINIDACTKSDKNPSVNSQVIEHKQNSDVNQGPYLCWRLTKNKMFMWLSRPRSHNVSAYTNCIEIRPFNLKILGDNTLLHKSSAITLLFLNEISTFPFGVERAGLYASCAFVCLFFILFCTRKFLSFFSSSWCQGLAAACDCDTA